MALCRKAGGARRFDALTSSSATAGNAGTARPRTVPRLRRPRPGTLAARNGGQPTAARVRRRARSRSASRVAPVVMRYFASPEEAVAAPRMRPAPSASLRWCSMPAGCWLPCCTRRCAENRGETTPPSARLFADQPLREPVADIPRARWVRLTHRPGRGGALAVLGSRAGAWPEPRISGRRARSQRRRQRRDRRGVRQLAGALRALRDRAPGARHSRNLV